jgi:hypothetical protein
VVGETRAAHPCAPAGLDHRYRAERQERAARTELLLSERKHTIQKPVEIGLILSGSSVTPRSHVLASWQ